MGSHEENRKTSQLDEQRRSDVGGKKSGRNASKRPNVTSCDRWQCFHTYIGIETLALALKGNLVDVSLRAPTWSLERWRAQFSVAEVTRADECSIREPVRESREPRRMAKVFEDVDAEGS